MEVKRKRGNKVRFGVAILKPDNEKLLELAAQTHRTRNCVIKEAIDFYFTALQTKTPAA